MGIKEKKLLIISNFINSESARFSLENKGRSIFYFFKKSSEESFVNKLNDFFNKHIDKSKDKNFDDDLKKILNTYEKNPKCSGKVKELLSVLTQEDKNNKTPCTTKQMNKFSIRDLSKQLKVILQNLKKLKQVIPIFNSQSVTKRTYVLLMNIYNDIDSAVKAESKDSSQVISESLDDAETLIPKAIASRLIKKSRHLENKSKINDVLSDVYEKFGQLKKILFNSSFKKLNIQVNNSITSNNSSSNDTQGIDITRLGYYVEIIDSDIPKLKKCIEIIDSDIAKLKKHKENSGNYKKVMFIHLKYYEELKESWTKLRPDFGINMKENINKLKSNKDLEKNLSEIINHLHEMRFSFTVEGITKWVILPESSKTINHLNEISHVITNLTNDFIEVSQLLFNSYVNMKSKSVEALNKAVDLEEVTNNVEKISVKDVNTKDINKNLLGPTNEKLDTKFDYDTSIDEKLVNSVSKERNDVENQLKLNEKDLNKNLGGDNKFPCIKDYEQKREEYLKSQGNESKNICSIIVFDFDFLYDAINKTFYDFNHYGYEKTYGGPYSVYNRLYSLLNTSLKDLRTSISDDSLKDFISSNNDKIYSLIDYLTSINTEIKKYTEEIKKLDTDVKKYNDGYRGGYPENVKLSENMYEFATKFLGHYFILDIQTSINSIKNFIDFKENQQIENIFIGDDCERKKLLDDIQKSEKDANIDIKLNCVCKLLSYDVKVVEDLKSGKNVPAPPKGWMQWGWDFIAGSEEYPKLTSIKSIFSELYNNIISNCNNTKQIDKFSQQKAFQFSDVKEIFNICSNLIKSLDEFDINKVNEQLEDQEKIKKLISELIKITNNDVKACLDCINKIKTNYNKEKYNSMFENPDRKKLISDFEKTNDLDEKLLTLIKIAVLDVNILNSQTSSIFYKYLPSFIVGNDDVKNKVDKCYSDISDRIKNMNKLSFIPMKQFYLNDIKSINGEVDTVISLINDSKQEPLLKNVDEQNSEDLNIFFTNILDLILNDFSQIKKFIEIVEAKCKQQLGKRPKEPENKLNEFKKVRNSILVEYNNLRGLPDSRILTLSRLVYNDCTQMSKFDKNILKQIGISCDHWYDFANNEKLTLNIVRDKLKIVSSNLIKIAIYLERLDNKSDVYKALLLLEKDINLFKDRAIDWITINSNSYNSISHEVYSDIDELHKEAFSDLAVDNGRKILVNYSGDSIKGNVMFSGFLLEYADLEDDKLTKNYIEKKLKGKLIIASKLKKAGMRGIKIIATAENLRIGNKSPGIDNSYSVAKVSEVNIKVKFFKKDIKVRVYIAYNKKTINYPININKIKNNLRAGELQLKPCTSSKSDLNIDEKEDSNIEDYKKYLNTLETLKKLISKEKNKKTKQKLMKIVKSLNDLDDSTSADIADYIEELSDGKNCTLFAQDSDMYNLSDNNNINIFDYLCILLTGKNILEINQKPSYMKNVATNAAKEAMKGAAVGLVGGVSGAVGGAIVGGMKGAWNYVFGSSTQKQSNSQNLKKIDTSKIMKGNICACTAIKSSVVEKNSEISISEESSLNPGYIWTTVDGTSKIVSKILKKFGTANISKQITKNDKIACISDLTIFVQSKQSSIKNIVMDFSEGLTEFNVRVRLYLTLGSISSFLARNFVRIELETPRGDIEID